MTRWWRSHSVRVQLTLWYAAAMIVVLGSVCGRGVRVGQPQHVGLAQSTPAQRFLVGGGDGRSAAGRHRHLARAGRVRRRGSALAAGLEPGRPAALPELGSPQSSVAGKRQPRRPGRQQDRRGADRHRTGPHAQQQRDDPFEGSRRHAGGHPDRAQRGADAPAAQRSGGHSRARLAARRGGGRLRRLYASPGGRWRRSSG